MQSNQQLKEKDRLQSTGFKLPVVMFAVVQMGLAIWISIIIANYDRGEPIKFSEIN